MVRAWDAAENGKLLQQYHRPAWARVSGASEPSRKALGPTALQSPPLCHSHGKLAKPWDAGPTVRCAWGQVGIHTVIDCATARPEESAQRVDWEGKVALIQCAQARTPAALLT